VTESCLAQTLSEAAGCSVYLCAHSCLDFFGPRVHGCTICYEIQVDYFIDVFIYNISKSIFDYFTIKCYCKT